MKPFTYAVIDDEPPARAALNTLMGDISSEAVCVGEAFDGVSGLKLLQDVHPDLLFLDIQFPPKGAFGMLEEAQAAGIILPPIAFLTAYDSFALKAFRWAACDYLVKPVEPEQLRETIRRAKWAPSFELLLDALRSAASRRIPGRFTVRVKGSLQVLRWADVTSIQTDNRLVFVHTADGRFILDRSLDELEPLLAPTFLRIHRSIMVKVSRVKALVPNPGHTSTVILLDGKELPVSRDRLAQVRRALTVLNPVAK